MRIIHPAGLPPTLWDRITGYVIDTWSENVTGMRASAEAHVLDNIDGDPIYVMSLWMRVMCTAYNSGSATGDLFLNLMPEGEDPMVLYSCSCKMNALKDQHEIVVTNPLIIPRGYLLTLSFAVEAGGNMVNLRYALCGFHFRG